MAELFLTFSVENGERATAAVRGESFVVGRHSSCDLTIADGRLSREHLKIERFDDEYFASDLGSSNGSTLNDEPLSYRVKLNDGDFLVLGGGVEIAVGFEAERVPYIPAVETTRDDVPDDAALPEVVSAPVAATAAPPGAASSGLSTSVFFIAPILGLLVLVLIGGLIYVMSDSKKPTTASNEFQYSTDDVEPRNKKKENEDVPTPTKTSGAATPEESGTDAQPSQTPSGEFAKIEANGTAFLRRIGANDSRAFLTGDQAKRVSSKVKQLSGSSALGANLQSARKGSTQIDSIAKAKNLKPQLLAVAALTKLGSTRGDVVQAASSMADVLDKLGTQIGNELADDSLLTIAAYDQGASGEFLKMRNQLQELANKYPDSSRQIRTIWFLKEKNQITESEFDRALTFLAIGIITQNPKDFGVNAEALLL